MSRRLYLLVIKLIVAFCSISYELILAQTLSVFLSNTVLRYSVTIGLYMLFMGAGVFLAQRLKGQGPHRVFWRTEISLTLVGMALLPGLFLVDALGGEQAFTILAHALVCLIGLLTGLELPLVLAVAREEGRPRRETVLSVDLIGAFIGTVVFAFLFYPVLGLVAAVWCVCGLNALAALVFVLGWKNEVDKARVKICLSIGLLLLTGAGLWVSPVMERVLLAIYLP